MKYERENIIQQFTNNPPPKIWSGQKKKHNLPLQIFHDAPPSYQGLFYGSSS